MSQKIWVTGDAVVDLIPDGENYYLRCAGGAPANVAVGVARLGSQSAFIGRVGNDPLGQFMQDTLNAENVNTQHMILDPQHRTSTVVVGLDGEKKMSKSLGNYIGVTDAPSDMFGKIMSISDELMWDWYNLLSFRPLTEIAELKAEVENGKNPRDVKILLAKEIIARFHDEAAAEAAEQEFINRFQKGAMPDEMPEFTFEGEIGLATLLKEAGLVPSTSEAIRSAKQGGVKINGEKVEDMKANAPKGTNVYQVGKRKFARVTIA